MIALLLIFQVVVVLAHDLHYDLRKEGKCMVLSFYFPDNTKFSYEKYEIYAEGSKLPFQVGRTDAQGRIAFCPDREGKWLVKTTSEDGHGAIVSVDVKEAYADTEKSLFKRYEKLFVGLGLILGIFGIFELYIRRLSWIKRFF